MAVDADRLWETLYPAAWKLARSADPIHDRIGEAFRAIRHLKGEDFPPDSRLLFNDITTRMTAAGAVRGEGDSIALGAVAHTLQSMDEGDACEVAEDIFKLFVEVAELHFRD